MTKIQHLQKSQRFLKKVALHRRNLYLKGVSKRAETRLMHEFIEGVLYMSATDSFDLMMNYLLQRETIKRLELLIPANYKTWRTELKTLIEQGKMLQGILVKQTEIIF
jgi:hypothetical protein